MKTIVDYKIETGANSGELALKVRQRIVEDWQPLGPPQLYTGQYGDGCWFQAMVKYESSETPQD